MDQIIAPQHININLVQNLSFLSQNKVQVFFFISFSDFHKFSSFCKENEIHQRTKKKKTKNYDCLSQTLVQICCATCLPPKKLGTLFVNTTALTESFLIPFFCIFVLGGFAVSVFGILGRNDDKQQFKTEQEGNKTTRCKQENHLILSQKKRKQTTQTQNDTNFALFKMETNNTRK